jgi:hypothetical protein
MATYTPRYKLPEMLDLPFAPLGAPSKTYPSFLTSVSSWAGPASVADTGPLKTSCTCPECTGLTRPILPDASPEDVLKLIKGARAELEERGWCKGSLQNLQGEVCVMGAMQYAAKKISLEVGTVDVPSLVNTGAKAVMKQYAAQAALKQASGEHIDPVLYRSVPTWNDSRYTTRDEVDEVLAATEECLTKGTKPAAPSAKIRPVTW